MNDELTGLFRSLDKIYEDIYNYIRPMVLEIIEFRG